MREENINNYDNFLRERIKGSIKDKEKFKEFTTFLTVWSGLVRGFQSIKRFQNSPSNGRRCRNVLELLINKSKISQYSHS